MNIKKIIKITFKIFLIILGLIVVECIGMNWVWKDIGTIRTDLNERFSFHDPQFNDIF